MIDRTSVERAADLFRAPEGSFDRLVHRQARRKRNQRIAAGVVGIATALAVAFTGARLIHSESIPADQNPAPTVRNGDLVTVRGLFWRTDTDPELVAVDPETGDTRSLVTCDQECYLSNTAWSPNGSELVFSSAGSVQVLDVGTGSTRILAPVKAEAAAFSPDGERIAYQASKKWPHGFFVTRREGAEPMTLDVLNHLSLQWFGWLPNGRSIVYFEHGSFEFGGGSIGIVEVAPHPTARTLVSFPELESSDACATDIPLSCAHSFAISPTDGRIAYASNDATTGTDTLSVVDPDDGTVSLVAEWPSTVFGARPLNPSRPARLAWSPDGSRIAFAVGCQIWSIAPDTSDRELIKDLDPCVGTPDRLTWSPDGTELAFVELDRNVGGILQNLTLSVLSVDGGSIRRLATLEVDDAVEIGPIAWQSIPIDEQP
jgi:dipeptidyl aminopeptidase/acylaminoacyl peptidase